MLKYSVPTFHSGCLHRAFRSTAIIFLFVPQIISSDIGTRVAATGGLYSREQMKIFVRTTSDNSNDRILVQIYVRFKKYASRG